MPNDEIPPNPDSSSPLEPDLEGRDPGQMLRAIAAETPPPSPGAWVPPLPEELAPLMPGYEITSVLGRGGMGAVYRAWQTGLEREVAIKLLPPELGADPEFEARFKREAKSMAKLNHPNPKLEAIIRATCLL